MKLNNSLKQFIVQELAMFSTPQEVVNAVKENFNVQLNRQHVAFYDASMNPKIPKRWKAIFDATRERFLSDVAAVPCAKKIVRLKKLSKMVDRFENLGNYGKAAEVLEQIAKEVGGMYVNYRVIGDTGGGGPVVFQAKTFEEWLKDDEERRLLAVQSPHDLRGGRQLL